jgi:hypothetical protein
VILIILPFDDLATVPIFFWIRKRAINGSLAKEESPAQLKETSLSIRPLPRHRYGLQRWFRVDSRIGESIVSGSSVSEFLFAQRTSFQQPAMGNHSHNRGGSLRRGTPCDRDCCPEPRQ